jgi:hypothetical protein
MHVKEFHSILKNKGINESDSNKILAVYKKEKCVKMDVNTGIELTHADFIEFDVLTKALKWYNDNPNKYKNYNTRGA